MVDRFGDEGATPLMRANEPFVLQQVDSLAHCHAGDAEFVLQLLKRGNAITDRPNAVAQPPPQNRRDLEIARHTAVGVVVCQFSRSVHHGL